MLARQCRWRPRPTTSSRSVVRFATEEAGEKMRKLKNVVRLIGATTLSAAVVIPALAQPAGGVGVLGVVGHWIEEKDGADPIVRVDGLPGRVPSAAEIEKAATTLFGKLDPTFAANAGAPGAFSLGVLSRVPRFTEGTFRARFKLVSGASDQTAGLVFDLEPNGEYLYARYNTKDGNLALWRFANGNREVIGHGEQHVQLPLGVWHELAVTITGSRLLAVANNGALRFEHTLPEPVDGRVGFWTKRDSVTQFKDVSVTPK
jgi:hypothetical protein